MFKHARFRLGFQASFLTGDGTDEVGVILADAWLITMNERRDVLEKASVYIEGARIAAIGVKEQLCLAHPDAEVVDCSGRIVMPGMVNTHTHLFQTLLKGLGDDMVLKKWFTCMTAARRHAN